MSIEYKADYFDNIKKNVMNAISKDDEKITNKNDTASNPALNTNIENNNKISTIQDISVNFITEFNEHVFKILPSNLKDLEESIKEYSVLTPITVRPTGVNRYEVLAGHHRLQASKNLGLSTIPCNVVNATDDEAKIIVVNSNKQRGFTDMKPSEIAFALKMEYDALKHQGKRTDLVNSLDEIMQKNQASTATFPYSGAENLTSYQNCTFVDSGERVANNNNLTRREIYRYIRLTSLIPLLLNIIDDEKIAFNTGVELSYLQQDYQQTLFDVVEEVGIYPTLKQAILLKELSKTSTLTEKIITDILKDEYSPKKKKSTNTLPTTVKVKSIKQYIPSDISTQSELDEYLQKALKYYEEYVASATPTDTKFDDGFAELENE